ncbi:hypothetical protein D3C81_1536460 [compost metagenome]
MAVVRCCDVDAAWACGRRCLAGTGHFWFAQRPGGLARGQCVRAQRSCGRLVAERLHGLDAFAFTAVPPERASKESSWPGRNACMGWRRSTGGSRTRQGRCSGRAGTAWLDPAGFFLAWRTGVQCALAAAAQGGVRHARRSTAGRPGAPCSGTGTRVVPRW